MSAVETGTASREGGAAPPRSDEQRPPSSWVLPGLAASAGTILGEVLGPSTTAKVIAGVLGAWIGGFLTAPGRHHRRRIVAVSLVVMLAAFLRSAASALAAGGRRTRSASAGGGGASAALPASWAGVMVTAAVGLVLGTGATALGTSLAGKGHLSDVSPAPRAASARVPNVVGLSTRTATARLQRAGFAVRLGRVRSRRPAGEVARQRPRPGELARSGSAVTLLVAGTQPVPSGAPPGSPAAPAVPGGTPPVEVPDVTGMSLKEATAVLGRTGFGVSAAPQPECAECQVRSQDPQAGAKAPKGSTVTLDDTPPPPPPALR